MNKSGDFTTDACSAASRLIVARKRLRANFSSIPYLTSSDHSNLLLLAQDIPTLVQTFGDSINFFGSRGNPQVQSLLKKTLNLTPLNKSPVLDALESGTVQPLNRPCFLTEKRATHIGMSLLQTSEGELLCWSLHVNARHGVELPLSHGQATSELGASLAFLIRKMAGEAQENVATKSKFSKQTNDAKATRSKPLQLCVYDATELTLFMEIALTKAQSNGEEGEVWLRILSAIVVDAKFVLVKSPPELMAKAARRVTMTRIGSDR